jgi:hypothetical protein
MWYVDADSERTEYTMTGHFFSNDSYIALYTYKEAAKALWEGSKTLAKDKDKHVLYFWQGLRSSNVRFYSNEAA